MKKAMRAKPTELRKNAAGVSKRFGRRGVKLISIYLGAESCRVSLATLSKDRITLKTVHRFSNGPLPVENHLFWDLAGIRDGVLAGIRRCAEIANGPINAVGVDGWAVDYVRLDRGMQPLADPFCYRDTRTETRQLELWKKIPKERIYKLTGIKHLRFTNLFQPYP